jgi:hypothetical protein
MVTEMEYQHMVYDEFVRRIAPSLPLFVAYDPTVNASISQEFASAVYRLGHSMLNETIARSNPNQPYSATSNQDVSLITGFTNPSQVRLRRPAVVSAANASSVGGHTVVTYILDSNEVAPPVGSVVTITGLATTNGDLNLSSAHVLSSGSGSFVVDGIYNGGSSIVLLDALSPAVSATATAISRKASVTNLNVANVVINDPGVAGYDYSPGEASALTAQGMSSQRGNEIDEFVTDAVRNNLLGLPLDLASLNLTRGRDVQLPTLNQFRRLNSA